MRCPACGVNVLEDAAYCHRCGAALELPAEGPAEGPAAGSDEMTPRQRLRGRSASTDPQDDTETELWRGTFSWKGMVSAFATTGLLSIGALVGVGLFAPQARNFGIALAAIAAVWVFLGLLLLYRRMSVNYVVTTQRFVHQKGILSRVTDRIEMIDVDDVSLTEGIVERMLGTGTIYITSSDRSHPEMRLRGLDNVREIARLIDDARRKERVRRGLHIESI